MNAESTSMLSHIKELRRLTVDAPSASERHEAAVLLIDLYEQVLARAGLLTFRGKTKH
jgi:hypothetical protein|tara:strand:- start:1661 stop:1834 length:174 start_codon:yes stop_codon:yes gene_type:complete